MAVLAGDKYQLRTLHAEIDLFDRKIAHLLQYGEYATESEKVEAARKMNVKRETLARNARKMAEDGVEFKDTELPRSFREDGRPAPPPVAEPEPVVEKSAFAKRPSVVPQSTYAGTSLDWQKTVAEYMEKRGKA